jgi:DNA-binding winged helix-turn-helix (wHTH) protein
MVDVSQQSESRIDQTVSFGPFCLQPGQHVLLEGDKPVQLGARALDILIVLTGRSGELVTKNELVATACPNVIVEESNLRAQVALLRKVLRDGRDGARYIVTVRGRGYRFVSPTSYSDPRGMQTPRRGPQKQRSRMSNAAHRTRHRHQRCKRTFSPLPSHDNCGDGWNRQDDGLSGSRRGASRVFRGRRLFSRPCSPERSSASLERFGLRTRPWQCSRRTTFGCRRISSAEANAARF